MTVPIAASPGRSGFGPQLALSYDSGAGNGPFGFGWSLSVPKIARKTSKGLPQYLDNEESDVFLLSSAEDLVPELSPSGARYSGAADIIYLHRDGVRLYFNQCGNGWSEARPPGEPQAVVVSRLADDRGAVTLDLDQLRQVSASGGSSPFDGWDALDTVFQLATPEPSVVFSRGHDLVIFTWSTQSWSTATLAPLAGGATGLSAAFLGLDGKLYLFVGSEYAEVDPAALEAPLARTAVSPRWGQQPSLFRTRLQYVDGAVFGPDSKLYLFSGESNLRYDTFSPNAMHQLVLSDADGTLLTKAPPKIADVWRTTDGKRAAINEVRSAFASNGRGYLSGRGPLTFAIPIFNFDLSLGTIPVLARYSQNDRVSPFQADPGYPTPFAYGQVSTLPTAFYGRLFALQDRKFSITRLTSNTSEEFSRALFARGIPGLLSLATQQVRELPYFTPFVGDDPPARPAERDELFVRYDDEDGPVTDYPGEGQEVEGLDFTSANAFYYWEVFFHIPFLIAQALKQEQRFEESLRWYEHVFDPTVPQSPLQYWKFLAFVDDSVREKTDLRPLEDQLETYRNDPFDPHAIAELRPLAYRKAFVMSYVDNLLLWGDMLFRQYTRESLGEATMLYVRAADILGKRPEELGKRRLSQTKTYQQLIAAPEAIEIADEILQLENWQLQRTLARGDTLQIGRQIKAAEIQVDLANQEVQVQRRLIKNNLSIDTFMNSKFTSKQLYQWMVGKLSATYFQTYNLALSYAKAAQRGMQFELALPESDVKYVGAGYWDSLKKGRSRASGCSWISTASRRHTSRRTSAGWRSPATSRYCRWTRSRWCASRNGDVASSSSGRRSSTQTSRATTAARSRPSRSRSPPWSVPTTTSTRP